MILYATCTVNSGYLSPYNPQVTYTPALDAFSSESTTFTRHRTEASMSGIAYASLLTGHQAPVHGVFTHPRHIPEDIYDITEAFSDGGFDIFYWWHHGMAGPGYRYAQGTPRDHIVTEPLRAGHPELTSILSRIREDGNYRAFVLTTFSSIWMIRRPCSSKFRGCSSRVAHFSSRRLTEHIICL